MANDLNLCQFIGRLGRDPEARYLQNGDPVTNISIAVGSSWKNKEGEKQESTEWVPITFYGKLAEIVTQYLRKGSRIYVSGRFKTRKRQDKETGQDHYTTEIVASDMQMLDTKDSGGGQGAGNAPGGGSAPQHQPAPQSGQQARPQQAQQPQRGAPPADDWDDLDVPF